jgi:hypothetical protein
MSAPGDKAERRNELRHAAFDPEAVVRSRPAGQSHEVSPQWLETSAIRWAHPSMCARRAL